MLKIFAFIDNEMKCEIFYLLFALFSSSRYRFGRKKEASSDDDASAESSVMKDEVDGECS
jgi:hypothetical protein